MRAKGLLLLLFAVSMGLLLMGCGATPNLNRPWHTATPRQASAATNRQTPTPVPAPATATPAAPQAEAETAAVTPVGQPTAQTAPVKIAVDEANPPFMYADTAGKAAGVYPVLLQAIFERMGMTAEVAPYPWKRALELSEKGEVAVGGIYKNEKRLQIYDYSDALYSEKMLIYVQKGKGFKFATPDDLKGKQVGVLTGWSYGDAFDQAKEKGVFTVQDVASDADNFEKLALGRVDCVVAVEASGTKIIQEKQYAAKVEALPTPLTVNDTYLVFAKSAQQGDLLKTFNATLAAMKQDGSYTALTGGETPATATASTVTSTVVVTTPTTAPVAKSAAVTPTVTVVATTAATVGKGSITLATLDWAPYVGQKLPDYGFTSEIISAAFKRAGYTVKIEFLPWARVLQEVETGKYDAGYPAYYSDERAQKYLLSDAFANGITGFYKRKADTIAYTSLQDLKPYRIGVIMGYVNSPEFDAATYLQKEEAIDEATNLNKLLAKRIDLTVLDKFTAQYVISTSLPAGKDALEFLEPPLLVQPLHVMVSRQTQGAEQKLRDFNEGLKKIRADGTLDQILTKYGYQ